MKLVFLDTEFTGEHVYATLVSMALLTVEGKSLHLAVNDYDEDQVTDWLRENVLAYIPTESTISSEKAYQQVSDWLSEYSAGEPVHLVSMGKANDLLLLFELWRFAKPENAYFHALHDLPPYLAHGGHLDMVTLFNLAGFWGYLDRVAYAGGEGVEGVRHHALYDARILRLCFLRLVREIEAMGELRDRLGLAEFGDVVFGIESNSGFAEVLCTGEEIPGPECFEAFGFEAHGPLRRIDKQSRDSNVYFFEADGRTFVLRTAAGSKRAELDAQCRLAATLPPHLFLKPLPAKDGNFVASGGPLACMCYEHVEGALYDGDPAKLPVILDAAFDLQDALSESASGTPLAANLRAPGRDFAAAREHLSIWSHPQEIKRHFGKELSPVVTRFLDHHQRWLNGIIELVDQSSGLFSERAPVHNDLQHANTLVTGNGSVLFLDIEDIVMAGPGEAMVHSAFKLHRHAIYSGRLTLGEFRSVHLPVIREKFAGRLGWQAAEPAWSTFGFGRTLFDIALITDHAVNKGDHRYTYDLNKKFENLIEFERMFH